MKTTNPAVHPMLLVDCPLCDQPAPFRIEAGDLECADCGVRLELAPEPEPETRFAEAA